MIDPLRDLVEFARLEVATGDIEPWAAVIGHLHHTDQLDLEETLWLVKLYNAYDDLGSAWRVRSDAPSPAVWTTGGGRHAAARWPCSRERRGLRGGRIVKHLDSYVAWLDGQTQHAWLQAGIPGAGPEADFLTLTGWLRQVWHVGRQTAFEWAEFIGKTTHIPVAAGEAQLYESSGPRRALQRLYGHPHTPPTAGWLNQRAVECRSMLAESGVALPWWDFETVICDFNVMHAGRYYPGQHIAMIREEIEALPAEGLGPLREALRAVVPEPWCNIPPGVDKQMARAYRDTGRIPTPVQPAVGGAR